MMALFASLGLMFQSASRCFRVIASYRSLPFSSNGPCNQDGGSASFGNGVNQEYLGKSEGIWQEADRVCQILESGSWGPSVENALSMYDEKRHSELVIGVLRRLKDVQQALNYFRWVEKKTDEAHCPEAYNMLLMVIVKSKRFDHVEQILEEMGLAGYGPSNSTCIQLIDSYVKTRKLRGAFDCIQTMRKLKFRPAFSAYTTLIGALCTVNEPDLMRALFLQMQELGYEVSIHLFTTLIRVFAREGRVDAALSILEEMKSNSLDADIVLYNVCINCFGKVGKVDMAWKFFHEMQANGFVPDEVTYTSMIGVLCKGNRLDEAVHLFEQMEQNRAVPCAYAYSTMIMGYGSAGKFDEAYRLLERQRLKGSIPSVISYNSLLTCLGKKGKVDDALRIFEEMKKDAAPNRTTYNIIIDMLCREGQYRAALDVRDAMKFSGLFPNVLTVNIMIDNTQKHVLFLWTLCIRLNVLSRQQSWVLFCGKQQRHSMHLDHCNNGLVAVISD
ncbi:unnamed protein product [Coffea canephora]|uniref:Uncharacterized protein n=1 Tax=Coffea canephora TaxID=49390 RepID=A0A068UMY5_COFCA|nr:unnamed protein product [Coffea canephora]